MLNLVIDVGNSFTKTGIFKNDELIRTNQYKVLSTVLVNDLINEFSFNNAIISSVLKAREDWTDILEQKTSLTYFTRQMAAGIQNHYKSPETLGLDRLAGITGAKYIFPGEDNLVIDGGTCITYDWVDKDGNYFGGSISPGLVMRYKALNYFTDALPLTGIQKDFDEKQGTDTISSMVSGVQNGIRYELTGFISSYFKADKPMNIVLTGGDSNFFDTLLKNSIFAPYIKNEPGLVLQGLNAAIQQH